MARVSPIRVVTLLCLCAGLAGCGSRSLLGSLPPTSGNSSVVLAMTDTPPSNLSILAGKVTLTGATLNPGSVTLFSGPTTVELTKLQTDIAYITTATSVPAGNYTSVTLTFANLSLTIENDTINPIGTCAVGLICTITPTATPMSTTISLTGFTTIAGANAGLLVDVSLDNLLSVTNTTMTADFKAGTTVTAFTPAGTGAPTVGAEDVVGQVLSITPPSNTFTLQNATASYSLKVDGASTFFQFPSSACLTAGFSCVKYNQILSVDIGIQADGSLHARNIVFEDADSSDTEVEGIVTSTNLGSQELSIVTLAESAAVPNLSVGDPATVQYVVAPQTLFDVDFIHADSTPVSTGGFPFTLPADLAVGQQVSVRRNAAGSSGTSGNVIIKADRVRLRSTRLTANVTLNGSSIMNLSGIPSIFSGHGIINIQVRTQQTTICSDNNSIILCSNIINVPVSVRGPLFSGGSARTLIATRIVEK